MDNRLDVFGLSQTEKGKSKCGDSFSFKVFHDTYAVLALSDGVGSKPCDWLASKTTCEKFIELFGEKVQTDFSPEKLIEICTAL